MKNNLFSDLNDYFIALLCIMGRYNRHWQYLEDQNGDFYLLRIWSEHWRN